MTPPVRLRLTLLLDSVPWAAHRAAVDAGARPWRGHSTGVCRAVRTRFGRRRARCFLQPRWSFGWAWLPSRPQQAATERSLVGLSRAPRHSYSQKGHCPGRPGFRRAGHTPSWAGQDLGLRETWTGQFPNCSSQPRDTSFSARTPDPDSGPALMCLCVHTRFLLKTRSGSYTSLQNCSRASPLC